MSRGNCKFTTMDMSDGLFNKETSDEQMIQPEFQDIECKELDEEISLEQFAEDIEEKGIGSRLATGAGTIAGYLEKGNVDIKAKELSDDIETKGFLKNTGKFVGEKVATGALWGVGGYGAAKAAQTADRKYQKSQQPQVKVVIEGDKKKIKVKKKRKGIDENIVVK